MTPPRWFFPLVAACLVVATGALVALVLRPAPGTFMYDPTGDGRVLRVLNTRTGEECVTDMIGTRVCREVVMPRESLAPAPVTP